MADVSSTTWPADPHTRAKHAILRRYLQAWYPILSRQTSTAARQAGGATNKEVLFIDGFAGPGEYTNGSEGSPVIALRAAIEHPAPLPTPIRMMFIEARPDRYRHLQSVIEPFRRPAVSSGKVSEIECLCGDCDAILSDRLDDFERRRHSIGPALAFLDQFGYGEVSMRLISRILKFRQCEVFTYLDYKDMNRWITDPDKAPAFTRAYDGEEWREAIDLPESQRRKYLLDTYKAALRDPKRGGAQYVASFSMFDRNDMPLYWLLFCTNSLRGLEEMKDAMWAVDRTGEFRFSDQDAPNQLELFGDHFTDAWLADELAARLAGKTMTVLRIKEYVLTETPCYLFKGALKSLETGASGKARVTKQPKDRKPGTYPDDLLDKIELRFGVSLF